MRYYSEGGRKMKCFCQLVNSRVWMCQEIVFRKRLRKSFRSSWLFVFRCNFRIYDRILSGISRVMPVILYVKLRNSQRGRESCAISVISLYIQVVKNSSAFFLGVNMKLFEVYCRFEVLRNLLCASEASPIPLIII